MINKIKILAPGKIKEKYLLEGIKEYLKRLRPFCKINIIELKDRGQKKEEAALKAHISPSTFILDEKGKSFTSVEFSEFLKSRNGEISFIIGGPDGISLSLKKSLPTISLSRMTFLHEVSRLLLLEQIYRSFMILSNRTYHK